ncbi:MAG: Ig-like domain-containing protein, partial [Acidimicrobiia bacterium]|nr:Ig-like domain-containing protein [Acidimicrobiia bacterium]
ATVTITVTPQNDPPVANDDLATTDEEVPVTIDVLANDTDPDSALNPASTTITSGSSNGTLFNNGDGTITYTPNPNFDGTDSFTYTVCDNDATPLCDTATVTITVNPQNDPPLAQDDPYSTSEDTPLVVAASGVLGNDTDPDGDPLAVNSYTQPGNGTVVVNPDGSFTYTPNPNFTGPDSFTYQACDPNPACDTATVTITVTPQNDPPVANDDLATTDEEVPVTIDVLANDTDPDSDPLTVLSATDPANGSVVINGDNTITYTPDLNFTGTDIFDYTISDGNGGTDTATVTITVTAVGNRPTAVDDFATTDEDTAVVIPAADLLVNDTDPDGDPLTIMSVTDSANGTVVLSGDVVYTPDPGFNGIDTFTYQVCDPGGACDIATVTVTVNPQNDPPVANDDLATTDEEVPVTIDVLANDTDPEGDPLSVTQILTDPANGMAVVNGDNTITYTPNPNFTGTDSFQYEISDGNGGFATAWVSFILVNPVNDDPAAVNDTATLTQDSSVAVPVLINDTDLDGDALDVQSVTQPANGTTVINGNNTITYTPAPGFTGTDTFTYTISDGNGGSAGATVTITVTPSGVTNNPVNDAPAANDDFETTDPDTPVVIDVLVNDSDANGDVLAVISISEQANGAVAINPDGTVTYTPAAGFTGIDTFTYTISDGKGGTARATVMVTVGVANAPPVFTSDPSNTSQTVTIGSNLLPLNAGDPDDDSYSFILSAGALPPGVSLNPDGTFSGSPASPGTFTATISVCDTNGLCSIGVLTVLVMAQRELPRTGVNSDDLAVFALLMMLLGGWLVAGSRRRQEQVR